MCFPFFFLVHSLCAQCCRNETDCSECHPSYVIRCHAVTDDEIDEVENDDAPIASAYLGCIALATFDGFSSSSEATNCAEGISETMLGRCRKPPLSRGGNATAASDGLLEIIGGDSATSGRDEVSGVLFPCRLDFGCDYSLFISHDDAFRVNAIDSEYASSFFDAH